MGRGVRNLELLSGVLNRHLFVRYRPYFLGGGVSITGAIITAGDFLHHCWRPVETTSPEVALRKPVTQPGDRKGRG